MAIVMFFFVISLINPSEFGGLPADASVPGLAYSVVARYGFPNIDNVSAFSLLVRGGLSFTFGYVPESISDILNYGTHMKFRNLTAVGFFSKNAAFYYRLVNRREVKTPDREVEYSIDEFSLAISDMLYYNLYGGLRLGYYFVRFGEALVKDGAPEVNLDTGNGFSIDLGMIYKRRGISVGISLKNVISGIYYSKYSKDVLNLSGGVGINLEPLEFFSFSVDGFIEKDGRPNYSSSLRVTPLKWIGIFTGYTLKDKSYGIGMELHYKSSDFIISYRKKAVFITWRYILQ
ncbi:MAG: hypothetical protein QMD82_07120 [bacterium]|nr:hypothetical protein [bacterium]